MRQKLPGLVFLVLAAALVGFLVAGRLGGGDDEPERAVGAPQEVADVVARLESATQLKEFGVLCDDLFTRSARTRAGGNDCVALLSETAKDVRRARIRLLDVRIQGDAAKVRVRTTAEGQAAVEETIDMVHEGGRYRISALAG